MAGFQRTRCRVDWPEEAKLSLKQLHHTKSTQYRRITSTQVRVKPSSTLRQSLCWRVHAGQEGISPKTQRTNLTWSPLHCHTDAIHTILCKSNSVCVAVWLASIWEMLGALPHSSVREKTAAPSCAMDITT